MDTATISLTEKTDENKAKDEEAARIKLMQQLQTDQQIKNKRGHRKRRHSVAEDCSTNQNETSKHHVVKHRRQYSANNKKAYAGDIILPTNFLLGGNIRDPLNLKSLLDENVNNALNAVTPSSSPLPPRSSKINIIIPTDMTDPLGLNQTQVMKQQQNITPSTIQMAGKGNSKKKKKRRKSHFDRVDINVQADVIKAPPKVDSKVAQKETKPAKNRKSASKLLSIENDSHPSTAKLTIALPKVGLVKFKSCI